MRTQRFVIAVVVAISAGCASPVGTPTPPGSPSQAIAPTGQATPSVVPPSSVETPTDLGGVTDRYADGLPRSFNGTPVLRGSAALAKAQSMTDDESFLITGWASFWPGDYYCGIQRPNEIPWQYCVRGRFSDVAGAADQSMTDSVTFHFIDHSVFGAVVASVHVHDPRADECGPKTAACDRLMVIERIVLSGRNVVAATPLSSGAVQRVLHRLQSTIALTPWRKHSYLVTCGDTLSGAEIYFPRPEGRHVPMVTLVEVEPSPAARRRALDLGAGPRNAFRPRALICSDFSTAVGITSTSDYRWLAIENVVVLVKTHHGMTQADRAFISRLATALQHASR